MSWKKVLYEYVHLRNQAGEELPAMPWVRDDVFMEAESARLRRSKQARRERGVALVKQETRLKVQTAEETEHRAVADLTMTKTITWEGHGQRQVEERVDRERVTLLRRGSEWYIQLVSPYIGDHDSTRPINPPWGGLLLSEDPDGAGEEVQPSQPFISKQVFAAGMREMAAPRTIYDRDAVRRYAETWWNSYNPQYLQFEVDCTNYVSQCLFAGRAPMHYTGKRESGWWYRGKSGGRELWSYSWAVAQSLQNYLLSSKSGLRGIEVSSPAQLTIGDVISYSWDGSRFTHSTIVTGIAFDGMPLVNAHTVNSRNRYWDYRDSYAWTERTAYRFFHIPDQL